MAHFGLRISKSESPDKTPYTVYYPHVKDSSQRKWDQGYYQVVSIDPARKNYGMRIERRYNDGRIIPIMFDKFDIESRVDSNGVMLQHTYQTLTKKLDVYKEFYNDCHFIIIERQLPQNYYATRIAQHTISYFCLKLEDNELLSAIIEVDPKLKGKMLGVPKNVSDKQLKSWAVEIARKLLTMRGDTFSLGVLDHFRNKQDDLSDCVCQIEALFMLWELPLTIAPPSVDSPEHKLRLPPPDDSPTGITQQRNILSLVKNAPLRTPTTQSNHLVMNLTNPLPNVSLQSKQISLNIKC